MPSEAMAGPPSGITTRANSRSSPAAVHPGRLQQLARDLGEEVPQQEDRERQTEGGVEEDHAGGRPEQPDLAEELGHRDQRDLDRHHQQPDHDQEPPVAAGEVHPGEGVSGERADHHHQDRRRHRDQHGVPAASR